MRRRHVAVLMGGTSTEHEVSVKSGKMVMKALECQEYEVTPILILRDGCWQFGGEPPLDLYHALTELRVRRVDCVFIALHGPFGEDGRIQGLLDLLGMPYTGSGCGASALAIDKIRCKAVVSLWGVSVAGQVVVARSAWQADRSKVVREIQERLGFPCVIKSPCQGSSLAMAIPKTPAELQAELPDLFAFDEVVLAEQFVEGVEVTCGVLDVAPGAEPVALPVTEIRPISSPYFDYHAKYTPGATEEITPARISEAATRQVQQVAIDVHKAVGCRHLSRSDMILAGDGPVWIEVNTIPGMTETSLYPQAAAVAGVPFPQLAGMLIESALSWPQSSAR